MAHVFTCSLLQRKKDSKFIDKDILAEAEYYFKNGEGFSMACIVL